MSQVDVAINGRQYRLNCGVGQEERLKNVVAYLNEKTNELDKITKQSGDTNLMLAAALLASSEVLDLRHSCHQLKDELALVKASEQKLVSEADTNREKMEAVLSKTAERIESLTSLMEESANKGPAAPEEWTPPQVRTAS